MTVQELIRELAAYPKNMLVTTEGGWKGRDTCHVVVGSACTFGDGETAHYVTISAGDDAQDAFVFVPDAKP